MSARPTPVELDGWWAAEGSDAALVAHRRGDHGRAVAAHCGERRRDWLPLSRFGTPQHFTLCPLCRRIGARLVDG